MINGRLFATGALLALAACSGNKSKLDDLGVPSSSSATTPGGEQKPNDEAPKRVEQRVEAPEALLPQAAVAFEPVGGGLERARR